MRPEVNSGEGACLAFLLLTYPDAPSDQALLRGDLHELSLSSLAPQAQGSVDLGRSIAQRGPQGSCGQRECAHRSLFLDATATFCVAATRYSAQSSSQRRSLLGSQCGEFQRTAAGYKVWHRSSAAVQAMAGRREARRDEARRRETVPSRPRPGPQPRRPPLPIRPPRPPACPALSPWWTNSVKSGTYPWTQSPPKAPPMSV